MFRRNQFVQFGVITIAILITLAILYWMGQRLSIFLGPYHENVIRWAARITFYTALVIMGITTLISHSSVLRTLQQQQVTRITYVILGTIILIYLIMLSLVLLRWRDSASMASLSVLFWGY